MSKKLTNFFGPKTSIKSGDLTSVVSSMDIQPVDLTQARIQPAFTNSNVFRASEVKSAMTDDVPLSLDGDDDDLFRKSVPQPDPSYLGKRDFAESFDDEPNSLPQKSIKISEPSKRVVDPIIASMDDDKELLDRVCGSQFDDEEAYYDFVNNIVPYPEYVRMKFHEIGHMTREEKFSEFINEQPGQNEISIEQCHMFREEIKYLVNYSQLPAGVINRQASNDEEARYKHSNNPRGFHLIFPLNWVSSFVNKLQDAHGSCDTIANIWDNASKLDEKGIWSKIRAVPYFIKYLYSGQFTKEYNLKLQDEAEKKYPKPHEQNPKLNPGWAVYQRRMMKSNPFKDFENWSNLWSLEGLNQYHVTQNPNHLHVHLCLFRKNKDFGIERFDGIKNAFIGMFKESITVRPFMSKNQLYYIGKERLLVAFTMYNRANCTIVEQSDYEQRKNSRWFFNLLDNNFDELLGYLDAHFESVATKNVGSLCSYCEVYDDSEKLSFCKRWGWDHRILKFYRQSDNPEFLKIFAKKGHGSTDSFDAFVDLIDSKDDTTIARVHDMLSYKSRLFHNLFLLAGVSPEETYRIVDLMTNIFMNWAYTSCSPQRHVYSKVGEWITKNLVAVKKNEIWRNALTIGGAGGSGKTTLGRDILIGLGFDPQVVQFRAGLEPSREQLNPINMTRFYDEAHCGAGGSKAAKKLGDISVYFNFSVMELSRSSLYRTNLEKKAMEFVICTAADFPDQLPNEKAHAEFFGTEIGYYNWKEQARRRFTLLKLNSAHDFMLPYTRFFVDKDAYVDPGTHHVIASDFNPLWRKYDFIIRFLFASAEYVGFSDQVVNIITSFNNDPTVADRISLPILAGLSDGDLLASGNITTTHFAVFKDYCWSLIWAKNMTNDRLLNWNP